MALVYLNYDIPGRLYKLTCLLPAKATVHLVVFFRDPGPPVHPVSTGVISSLAILILVIIYFDGFSSASVLCRVCLFPFNAHTIGVGTFDIMRPHCSGNSGQRCKNVTL